MNIGIDIGGSHIGVGIVEKEKIISKKEINIKQSDKNIEEFIEKNIANLVNLVLRENNLHIENIGKIGIATPGTIVNGKIITNVVNLGIKNLNLHEKLKKYFPKTEIIIKNDGKCAAIAEKLYGNMKNFDEGLFICLGSGVGGAVFTKGKLLESNKYSGYEIGHISIKKDGKLCKCGKRGCFDIYGSMKNFKIKLTNELEIPNKSISYDILPKLEGKRTKEVQNIIDEYIYNLSIGISNLINIFEPEIVVIGGSFSFYQSLLLEPLKEKIIKDNLLFNKRSSVNIVAAKLFNDAGIIGAGNL